MEETVLKMFSRIKQTGDGIDLLAYLKRLSSENYEAFKQDVQEHNDIHKGYAIAIDSLVAIFETCDTILSKRNTIIEHSEVNAYI